jgi:hypothetical protein
MAQTLASELNQPLNPSFLSQSSQRMQSDPNLRTRGAKARELEPLARAEETRLAEQTGLEEARLKREQIGREEELAREGMGRKEQIFKGLEDAMGQQPERTITAFNPERGIELATMTALLGAFAGSVSGTAALQAMEGVSTGYRTGQEDLYKREVEAYDAAVNQYKQKIKQAEEIAKNSLVLEAEQRGLGAIELKKLDPLLNDGLIIAKAKQGDVRGMLESIKQAKDLGDQIRLKEIEAGLKTQARKVIPLKSINAEGKEITLMVDINDPNFDPGNIFPGAPAVVGEAPTKGGSGLALTAAQKKDLDFRKRLVTELEDLEARFKDAYAGFGTDAIGFAKSTATERLSGNPDMALWWSQFQNIVNPERHEIYGATLTKSEQEAWRRGSVGPGNNPRFVKEWFKLRRRMLANSIEQMERSGGLSTADDTSKLDAGRKAANDAIQKGASENDVRNRFREIYGEEL